MTTTSELLTELVDRVRESTHGAVEGLGAEQLAARPAEGANTIAWLAWHVARGQDAQVADVAGTDQVWTTQGFARDFGLPFDDDEIGYGFDAEQVGQVRATAEQLLAYLDAVCEATTAYLRGLSDADLDRVVDDSYDPPVTLAARLVSVVSDDLQHAGQAAYARGLR